MAVGGLLLTLITYARVSQGGGTYFVAYGPMIFGVILFFVGLSKSSKGKSKAVIKCANCGMVVNSEAEECRDC